MGDLLEELKAKGDGVTGGLKKVTGDMKTKNQGDKTSVVRQMSKDTTKKVKKGPAAVCRKRDGWAIANFDKNDSNQQAVKLPYDEVIEVSYDKDVDKTKLTDQDDQYKKQTVSITDCVDTTFQLTPNKLNSLMLCNCHKVNVVLNSLIAGIELTDCTSVSVQVLGVAQSVAIDKCAGVRLYVSKDSKQNLELTTSTSSDMTINFPKKGEEDEWVECPIPEQFVHHINVDKNSLKTEVSYLYSG